MTLLKEFGSPKEVAASYQPKDQYLIGPELFPIFRLVTLIVIAAVLGSLLLAMGINVIVDPGSVAIPQPESSFRIPG